MTADKMLRNSQTTSNGADLILEQPFERLTQFKAHFLRQAAHIVMALYGLAGNIQTLNTVRVNSSLCQPLGILYL